MMYNVEKPSLDDLVHFGVKGMKWGKRKGSQNILSRIGQKQASGSAGKLGLKVGKSIQRATGKMKNMQANYSRARVKGFKIDRDSLVNERKAMLGLKSSNGKPLFTEKDMDDMIGTLEKNIQKYSSKADTYDKLAKTLMSDIDSSRRK